MNHFPRGIVLVVHDLDRILSEGVALAARLGALNKHLELQLDGLQDGSLRSLGADAQRSLDVQAAAAREAGAFDALLNSLEEVAAAGAATPAPTRATAGTLRDQLARLRTSFDTVRDALRSAATAVMVADAQSAEYQAFALSLRETALLKATMQKVAESGLMVLQRLAAGREKRLQT